MIATETSWTRGALRPRLVRYAELRPCYNAFIDTRSPGSEAKENFTIIGPGVSENPAQHVHIAEPHGFNIGGARQPPNCVNSPHSHDTAEVFVVHSGRWRFDLGEHGDDARLELGPGDTISIPTGIFRGFTNIGDDLGYLFAVLGQDDPGRVTWAPKVFEMARDYGLVLLENGSLVDTAAGESIPDGVAPMPPTTAQQAAALRRVNAAEAAAFVVRDDSEGGSWGEMVIGDGAPIDWPHGFSLERLAVAPGEPLELLADVAHASVLYVHRGDLSLATADGTLSLGPGDVISLPAGFVPHLSSGAQASAFMVRRDA
ncbi:cupin domain-containing protein [Sandaracinobacteroides saxicola]|uniref:Cupin domain-containing protein n=1 Tax=Sandaracinobacteroides saxicola TaxID=2759707 RepID=A0A7G5IEX3_9SPHN|nr:cupin domain-containing protein [Sandaracinobacteroides saxicola]QMW21915.1 cupin domain-containing protein [Sandaracinobacteroides saxicola]